MMSKRIKSAAELKVSDWQMIAWTSWACDSVDGLRACFEGFKDGKFKLIRHSTGSQ